MRQSETNNWEVWEAHFPYWNSNYLKSAHKFAKFSIILGSMVIAIAYV